MRKKTAKGKSPIAKTRENLVRFCEILDDLPTNFSFKLNKVHKDFNGSWEKTVLNGTTVWHNGSMILLKSSFFRLREKVFDAIEKEGYPLREIYFSDMRRKRSLLLTKKEVREQYYGQRRSLAEIGKQCGCTRQNIMALMEQYGLKRRTRSKARLEAVKKKKMALTRWSGLIYCPTLKIIKICIFIQGLTCAYFLGKMVEMASTKRMII